MKYMLSEKNKFAMLILILLVFLTLMGCDASPTVKVSASKLSIEELGTRSIVSRYLNGAAKSLVKINKNINKAIKSKEKKNLGIADSFYANANKEIYKWRDLIVKRNTTGRPKLIYPESMSKIGSAFRKLMNLKYLLPASGKLSVDQLNEILNNLRAVVAADVEFSKVAKSRKRNPDIVNPKFSLVLELKPFPFSIEILHGELKIKQNFSVGNLSGNFGASTGSKQGITTLVLVHDGNARVYSVGNRKLSFEVPASRIDINGKMMRITTLE